MSAEPPTAADEPTSEVGASALRDAVVEMTRAQGDGVTARVDGASVIVSRRRDFLHVTPRADGGIDLVFRFPAGPPNDPRLEPLPGRGHLVRVRPTDVDADLLALEPLLEAAYAQNG